jgi:hypothetical protein
MKTIDEVPMILRREIEALMIAPFLMAFSKEIGEEKTQEIARKVISDLATKAGEDMAKAVGGNSLECLGRALSCFGQDGILETDMKENTPECIRMNVTKCGYTKMYRKNGIEDFGTLLSCERDGCLFNGFNPDIEFTRTKTIMNGGDVCDFCLKMKKKD